MKVNEKQKVSIVAKMEDFYGASDFSGKTFGIWGLAFKPETDDVREAPSLYITKALIERGAKLMAYDPEAIETFKQATTDQVIDNTTFVASQEDALKDVDALIICTEWNEFRRPTIDQFKNHMKHSVIFDGRNLFDLERAQASNIQYISVGRPTVNVS